MKLSRRDKKPVYWNRVLQARFVRIAKHFHAFDRPFKTKKNSSKAISNELMDKG